MCFVPMALFCLIKSKKRVKENFDKNAIQLRNCAGGINEDVTDVESAEEVQPRV